MCSLGDFFFLTHFYSYGKSEELAEGNYTTMINLHKFIEQNQPNENISIRVNCPMCSGRNTFTITKMHGKLLWNCYKASCKIKGGKETKRSKSDIKTIILSSYYQPSFQLPDYFVSVHNNQKALTYLKYNNCLDALQDKRAKIMYDPKQDRVVFVVSDGSQHFDAIGRSLNKKVIPKWYRYGKSQKLFFCGSHDYAILVEDAASACAVSTKFTGVALLGTNMKDADLTQLKNFKHVFICLDADATRKSLDLQKYLSYIVSASVVRLKEDLKYYDIEQISEVIWKNN